MRLADHLRASHTVLYSPLHLSSHAFMLSLTCTAYSDLPVVVPSSCNQAVPEDNFRGLGVPTMRLRQPKPYVDLATTVWGAMDDTWRGTMPNSRRRQMVRIQVSYHSDGLGRSGTLHLPAMMLSTSRSQKLFRGVSGAVTPRRPVALITMPRPCQARWPKPRRCGGATICSSSPSTGKRFGISRPGILLAPAIL